MAYPSVHDDGQSVQLDLHGSKVRHAKRLFENTLLLACERGRSTVKVIYGTSTSVDDAFASSIKHTILDMLVSGEYSDLVSGYWETDGHALVSLIARGSPAPQRITIFEIDN